MNRKQRHAAAKSGNPEALVALAHILATEGKMDESAKRYRQALSIKPGLANAHNDLANLLQAQGRFDEAIAHYQKAIEIRPQEPVYYNNLGNVAAERGLLEEAIRIYCKAIALRSNYAEAHYNLARALVDFGQVEDGITHYQRALELKPQYISARIALGHVLADQGRLVEALDHAEIASRSSHESSFPLYHYGVLLARCGCADAAKICFETCLERDPEDRDGVGLLLAGLGYMPMPERASSVQLDEYYARRANFWDQKAASGERVGYRGADLVSSMLDRLTQEAAGLDIIDAGCGTGLVGILVAGKARQLIGVDASSAMLAMAKKRSVYHRLHQGDLIAFLNGHSASFDALTCAATLIHFGDLRPAFEAAAASLRDFGLFIFTLFPNEDDDDAVAAGTFDGYAQGGCFRHGRNYVARLAEMTGFKVEALDLDIHEYARGKPRMGLIVALRRLGRPDKQASAA
jgi:predicted TPR repeat methyltransferase